jgi:hypothetical protein
MTRAALRESTGILGLPGNGFSGRRESPSSGPLPAARFQAAFFANPPSLTDYPSEPSGSSGPQKSFDSRFYGLFVNVAG